MDANGVITLSPESSVEAFALRHWTDIALVQQEDPKRREQCHWRGSRLIVSANIPEQRHER